MVCQPISELHLGHTTALVLCLRPRLPQPPLDLEALQEEVERERREKIAKDLVEDGQASVEGGGEGEGSLEEKVKELDGARMRLQALEATMSELIEKKEHGESALEVSICEKKSHVTVLKLLFLYCFVIILGLSMLLCIRPSQGEGTWREDTVSIDKHCCWCNRSVAALERAAL